VGAQARAKQAKAAEKKARAGTLRLHLIEIKVHVVAYDEHGRAQPDGTGNLEPIYLMESQVGPELLALIRSKAPNIPFVTIEPKSATEA
jgi:hypothetical protein